MKKVVSMVFALLILVSSCVTVFAESFVPSVSSDGSPVLISAMLADKEGRKLLDLDGVTVTPYNNRSKAPDSSVREDLEAAYRDFQNNSLMKLVPDVPKGLVLSEVFYVSIPDGYADMMKESEGSSVVLILKTDKKYKTAPVALFKTADGKWVITDGVTLNKNGTVAFSVSGGGAYAFLTEKSVITDDSDITSPKTGYDTRAYLMTAFAVAVSVAAVFVYTKKKAGMYE